MSRRFALFALVVVSAVLIPTTSASATLVPCDEGRSGTNYAHACLSPYGDRYEWKFTPTGSQFAYLEVSTDRASWVTLDATGYVSTPFYELTSMYTGAKYWRIRLYGGGTIGGTATDTLAVGGSNASVPGGYVPPNECAVIDVGCNFEFAGRYFFIPSDGALDQFTNLGTTLQGAVPFGYFTDLWTILDGVFANQGAVTPASISVREPFASAGQSRGNVILLDENGTFGQLLIDQRPLIEVVLWFMSLIPLGFYLWRKMIPAVEG